MIVKPARSGRVWRNDHGRCRLHSFHHPGSIDRFCAIFVYLHQSVNNHLFGATGSIVFIIQWHVTINMAVALPGGDGSDRLESSAPPALRCNSKPLLLLSVVVVHLIVINASRRVAEKSAPVVPAPSPPHNWPLPLPPSHRLSPVVLRSSSAPSSQSRYTKLSCTTRFVFLLMVQVPSAFTTTLPSTGGVTRVHFRCA